MVKKILFSRMTIVKAVDEEEAKAHLARVAGECIFAGFYNTEVKEGVPLTFKWTVEPYESLSVLDQTQKVRVDLEVWHD